jgi:hypothetical protein
MTELEKTKVEIPTTKAEAPKAPAKAPIKVPMVSVLATAVSAQEGKQNRDDFKWRILLVGPTGSGKSTFLTTLPSPKLVIDWDMRKESILGLDTLKEGDKIIQIPEPDPRSPSAWDKGEILRKELWKMVRQKAFPYKTVIEDGLSFMDAACMRWSLLLDTSYGLGGAPAKQHYSPLIKNLGDHLDSMRSLPCHYALTAHAMLMTDLEEQTTKTMTLKVNSKVLKASIPTMFNEIWMAHSYPDKDGQKYLVHTAPTGSYDFLKSGVNMLSGLWKSPIKIDWDEEPKGCEKLFQLRFGKGA